MPLRARAHVAREVAGLPRLGWAAGGFRGQTNPLRATGRTAEGSFVRSSGGRGIACATEGSEDALDVVGFGDGGSHGEASTTAGASAKVDLKCSTEERTPIDTERGGVERALLETLPMQQRQDVGGDKVSATGGQERGCRNRGLSGEERERRRFEERRGLELTTLRFVR